MDLATVELLASPEGWSLLAALPEYDESQAVTLGTSLREAGYSPDLVAAALTQSRLRAKAREKFGEFASGMVFTPDGLEQATRLELAARHAARYRDAGTEHVYDLGCGIGADAMTFAGLGLAVTAVDADPATAALAALNLRHFPDATARTARAEEVPLPGATERLRRSGDTSLTDASTPDAHAEGKPPTDTGSRYARGEDGHLPDTRRTGVWFDPARRDVSATDAAGRARRLHGLDAISPPWSFVQETAARVPATGAKLAPNFPRAQVPDGAEAQWTSWHGEVLECAVWWGPLAQRPGRSAAVLTPEGGSVVHQDDAPDSHPLGAGLPVPGEFLYEPDRAVIAAGLVGALAAAVDGAELAAGVGYVVSDEVHLIPWATRYVITHAMKPNVKQVRAWLRGQGAGRLTLKRRGGRIDPDRFRRDLKLNNKGNEVTAVLTVAGTTPAFLAVERV